MSSGALVGALGISLSFVSPVWADSDAASALSQMSIEDLANVSVSSVLKSSEPLSDAPAAVYVITHDDIVHSGATTIPEMLRLAPNLVVAQDDASTYAISARGFNGALADKLLVLLDGRTVYSPLYAGVYWDSLNVPVEDIDRIEVVSGPGGTLWGSNAVNGVINIVTRGSGDTQGGLVDMGAGTREQAGTIQYGGKAGTDATYRVYGDAFGFGRSDSSTGTSVSDAWSHYQDGFRVDWHPSADLVTVQGDAYSQWAEQVGSSGAYDSGKNLLTRWTHPFDAGSSLQVQAYYDDTRRYSSFGNGGFAIDTYDLDIQHNFAINDWNKIVWGGGERVVSYNITGTSTTLFNSPQSSFGLANIFAADTISITDRVKLIPGIKFEDDPYVGVQPLPSVRLSWKADDTNLFWGAVSRAVRAPTPFDRDLEEFDSGTLLLEGSDTIQPEKLTAYELGYRAEPTTSTTISVSTFYNVYDDLRSINATPGTTVPLVFGNLMSGDTYGVETWGGYRVNSWWRLAAGFTLEHENFHFLPGETTVGAVQNVSIQETGDDPTHHGTLRSTVNLSPDVVWEADLREMGALPNLAVPAYTELDSRIGWTVSPKVELSLSGFNLLHAHHLEFVVSSTTPDVEIGRSLFADLRVRF